MNDDAIGGYLAFEPLAMGGNEWYRHALRFQSARSAFLALLQHERPARVWLPWHLCNSMRAPLQMAGIEVAHYGLDAGLAPLESIPLAADEWLLYVNYFGICDRHVADVLRNHPAGQVVIDASQAFFSPSVDCLATIYSPRKFFGVPDGGYLVTDRNMTLPDEQDQDSIHRCVHLLKRHEVGAEAGYADYQQAEASLNGQKPRRMSELTRGLLSQIDYAAARSSRHTNFLHLHRRLQRQNRLPLVIAEGAAPLCYPYLIDEGESLRARLREQRIFVPVYWPEVGLGSAQIPAWEQCLARKCLALPCDQRYSATEMDRILEQLG